MFLRSAISLLAQNVQFSLSVHLDNCCKNNKRRCNVGISKVLRNNGPLDFMASFENNKTRCAKKCHLHKLHPQCFGELYGFDFFRRFQRIVTKVTNIKKVQKVFPRTTRRLSMINVGYTKVFFIWVFALS